MSKEIGASPGPFGSKKHKRSNSNTEHSSDDELYAGVEQISDTEEDEPDVEKAEERAIIFAQDRGSYQDPYQYNQEEIWQGFSDCLVPTEELPLFGDEIQLDSDWYAQDEPPVAIEENDSKELRNFVRERSVDFESSDDEIEMFDDVFPDIFIDKDKLDSSFRRQIDRDDVSDSGSYWEHEDMDAMYGEPGYSFEETVRVSDEDEEYDSESSVPSGYATDMSGETTDDDLPVEFYTQLHRPDSLLSESESDFEDDDAESSATCTPQLYSWKHTSNKPFATVSSNCKKMVLFNVQRSSRQSSQDSCPLESPMSSHFNLTSSPQAQLSIEDVLMSVGSDPIINSSNLNTGLSLFHHSYIPATGLMSEIFTARESSSDYDTDNIEELCADTTITNLDEFINFESEESSNSDDDVAGTANNHAINDSLSSSSARPSSAPLEEKVHPLIPHFNRGIVGSWRQKQNTHQLLHRNIASQDSLAFGGNLFMEGTLKGVKSGRLRHANTPITPVRKQKTLNPIRMKSSGFTASQKRKLGGRAREDFHKFSALYSGRNI